MAKIEDAGELPGLMIEEMMESASLVQGAEEETEQGHLLEEKVTSSIYIIIRSISTECPAKLFPLGYLLFCRLLLMQIAKVGSCMKNSGNLVQDRHKNFKN